MSSSRCSTSRTWAVMHVAVVAGHAVALDDLGALARELGDLGELPRRGPDADDHAQAQPSARGSTSAR